MEQKMQRLRVVERTCFPPQEIDSQELLRSIVRNHLLGASKKMQYQPLKMYVLHGGKVKSFVYDIHLLLELYEECKGCGSLEEQTTAIIRFIAMLSNEEKYLEIQRERESIVDVRDALECLLAQYCEEREGEREKKVLAGLNINQKKMAKVSLMVGEHPSGESGRRLTRSSIHQFKEEAHIVNKSKLNSKSLLNKLINKCNIFEQPDKIEALKRQKFIEAFCESAEEYDCLREKHHHKKDLTEYSDNHEYDLQCLQMLEEWVGELTLSEELIERRLNAVILTKETEQSY